MVTGGDLVAAVERLAPAGTSERPWRHQGILDERRDLHNIAMLACTFGCDALYESGWITVDDNGLVQTWPPDRVPQGSMRDRLSHLNGRASTAYTPSSAPYFEWHRTTIFKA